MPLSGRATAFFSALSTPSQVAAAVCQDENDGDPGFDSSASTIVDAEGDQGQREREVSSGTGARFF